MNKPLDETIYNEEFHKDRNALTEYTAKKVLSHLFRNIKDINAVVDVGCGTGTWLRVAKEMHTSGEIRVRGIDGGYLPIEQMEIEAEEFIPCNLEDRIEIDQRFDLAISLEVAEHLSPERAESFVDDLTLLSDIVLFSAAIPGQGGEGHINENFLSYWERLFSARHYQIVDCVRPEICRDQDVCWWYRQNIVVFCREDSRDFEHLKSISQQGVTDVIDRELYYSKLMQIQHLYTLLEEQTAAIQRMRAIVIDLSEKTL